MYSARRRGKAFVTPNACTECRRRKAKCDGNQPCGKCAADLRTCVYGISTQKSKEALRLEIQELRNYRQMSGEIFNEIAQGDNSEAVLTQLRNGVKLEQIMLNVRGPSNLSAILSPSSSSSVSKMLPDIQPKGKLIDGASTELNIRQDVFEIGEPVEDSEYEEIEGDGEPWTVVTNDKDLMKHLLLLYFCWEYPIFATVSKKHFWPDYVSGKRRYCSSVLVNVLLALGEQYSAKTNAGSSRVLSSLFYNEAERLLDTEQDKHSITTVQALGIMSILELSRGDTERSIYYSRLSIRMAIEMGLHIDEEGPDVLEFEREARRATAWGAFALDHAWSVTIGSIPHISRAGFQSLKPSNFEREEHDTWQPYTGEQVPDASLRQISNTRSVYVAICDLFAVIHETLYIVNRPMRALTAKAVLAIYARYLSWYESIPASVRLGDNTTPSAIFVHMYYHYSIILLFGPFIRLRLQGSDTIPYEICTQAAQSIISLLDVYKRLYGLQRTPAFFPIITLASNTIKYVEAGQAISPTSHTQQVSYSQDLSSLREMAFSHAYADRCISILQYMQRNADLEKVASCNENNDRVKAQERIPISFFGPELHIRNYTKLAQSAIENSLFSPFPNQIIPITEYKAHFGNAGFEFSNRM